MDASFDQGGREGGRDEQIKTRIDEQTDTWTQRQNDGRSDRRVVIGRPQREGGEARTGEDLCAEQGGKARHGDHECHVRRRGEDYTLPEQAGHVQRTLRPPYCTLGCSSRHLFDDFSSSRAPTHLSLVNSLTACHWRRSPDSVLPRHSGDSRSRHGILHWKFPGREPQPAAPQPNQRKDFFLPRFTSPSSSSSSS